MVSYKKIEQDEDNVLFEAPSHALNSDIELQPLETDSRIELLSSFQDDEESQHVISAKSSDDRLRVDDSNEDDLQRSIRDTVNSNSASNNLNNASSSTSSSSTSSNSNQTSSLPGSDFHGLNLNYVKNKFNFLDSIFNNNKSQASTGRTLGRGTENDGVFNNLSAKPDTHPQNESDKPPTYDEASADATPPYWENSVIAPGFADEVFVDGLPVGNIINFIWNFLVCFSFQFVGFLLTYILHTSHAAKQGSRAGLGVTFISYGLTMIPSFYQKYKDPDATVSSIKIEPDNPNDHSIGTNGDIVGSVDSFHSDLSGGVDPVVENTQALHITLLAYGVIVFGLFIIFRALVNYQRARKMEQVILQPPQNITPEEQV